MSWVAGASEEGPEGPRRSELFVHIEIISVFDWGTKNENRLEM